MTFVGHVARKFQRSRGSRLLSLITLFAGLGIILGVMVLDVTLAVMNGFRDQIQLKFVENMPMVTVLHRRGGFTDLEATVERLAADREVLGAAPYLRSPGILVHERIPGSPRQVEAVVWGIDPDRQSSVTRFHEVVAPEFEGFATDAYLGGGEDVGGIVLGEQLSAKLGAFVGDKLSLLLFAKTGTGPDDWEAVTSDFIVVGTMSSGMYEFDSVFAYVDLQRAQQILRRPGQADGIGLRVVDMMSAPLVADRLEQELGGYPWDCTDWIRMNEELFKWIQYEKVLMFLLLTFLIVIASLNVVALLVMMVRDRRRDIGVLLALGARRHQVAAIFLRLGLTISGVGTLIGTALGWIITVAFDKFEYELPGDVLFVDVLPVHAKWEDFALVAAVTLLLSVIVSLLPAWLASRQTPVEVLRYE